MFRCVSILYFLWSIYLGDRVWFFEYDFYVYSFDVILIIMTIYVVFFIFFRFWARILQSKRKLPALPNRWQHRDAASCTGIIVSNIVLPSAFSSFYHIAWPDIRVSDETYIHIIHVYNSHSLSHRHVFFFIQNSVCCRRRVDLYICILI